MIAGSQMKAARALLAIDQRELARISGLSLPTIQQMESCDGTVRGNVESLMKVTLQLAGVKLIAEGANSLVRHRGFRLDLAGSE